MNIINYLHSRLILTTGLLMLLIISMTSIHAQNNPQRGGRGSASPEDRAKRQTEMMKESLSLTAAQEPKVSAINLKYAKKMEEVRKVADTVAQRKSAQKLNQQKEGELKTVLTAAQFKSYLKQVEEMKARRRGMQH
jgi:hypothetical protein